MQMSGGNQFNNWNLQSNNNQQQQPTNKKVKLTTNLYQVRMDKLMSAFFKYQFLPAETATFEENLLTYRSMKEKRSQFEARIQFVCEYKGGFLGSKRVDGEIELTQPANHKLFVKLKLTQAYNLEEMMKQDCKQAVLNHLIEPIVKKSIKSSEIDTKIDHIGHHKIAITPNFYYNFVEIKNKIYLATNVKISIREHCSLQTYFERYKDHESHKKLMINRQVIANYGQRDIYTIVNIDYVKTPQSISIFNNKQCTFAEYYKEKHIINIANLHQHLLVATRYSKQNNQTQTVFLIPELVSFYNSVNPNEMDEQMVQKIEKKKWQLPQDKEIYALGIIKQLGENEIIKKSAHNFDGIIVSPPAIKIEGRTILPQEGIFSFRGRIQKAVEMKNWGIVYIEGRDKQADTNDISKLLFFMKGVCIQYGIRITNEPGMIPVKGDVNEWKKAIQSDIQRFGMPQFLIFLLRQDEISLYSSLKQYIVMELKCPSQVIRRKSLQMDTRKPFSIVSDILLQIQAKIGGVPWEIASNTELSKKRLMFGGIYLAKQKDGYSVSFVGCINSQGAQVYSYNKRGFTKISDINFELLFIHWAKNYVITNRVPPDTIIVYRQQSEDCLQKVQISDQINQIKSAIKKIGQKTKTANYNPSISYISVSKHHHVQIYSKCENEQKEVIIENPDAGTVVVDKNENESTYDFYLNGNRDLESTSKPVKFTVSESFGGINSENLIGFTYEQCYNYFNYKGALKVPAYLQYAKKLASFSESTGIQIGFEDKMTKMLYFL